MTIINSSSLFPLFSLVPGPLSLFLILNLPFRLAEKHRMRRGFRDAPVCAQRVQHPTGSFEHRREPAGRACWVSFLLVPFLWISKEKILAHKGRKAKLKFNRIEKISLPGKGKTNQLCASTKIKPNLSVEHNAAHHHATGHLSHA